MSFCTLAQSLRGSLCAASLADAGGLSCRCGRAANKIPGSSGCNALGGLCGALALCVAVPAGLALIGPCVGGGLFVFEHLHRLLPLLPDAVFDVGFFLFAAIVPGAGACIALGVAALGVLAFERLGLYVFRGGAALCCKVIGRRCHSGIAVRIGRYAAALGTAG